MEKDIGDIFLLKKVFSGIIFVNETSNWWRKTGEKVSYPDFGQDNLI